MKRDRTPAKIGRSMKKCDRRMAWPSIPCGGGKKRQMCLNLEAGAQPHQAVDSDAVRWQQAARDHAHSVVFKRADLDLWERQCHRPARPSASCWIGLSQELSRGRATPAGRAIPATEPWRTGLAR